MLWGGRLPREAILTAGVILRSGVLGIFKGTGNGTSKGTFTALRTRARRRVQGTALARTERGAQQSDPQEFTSPNLYSCLTVETTAAVNGVGTAPLLQRHS